MPGARELLDELAGLAVPTALVSASLRPMVDAVLGHIGADHFAATVAGDEPARSKPHPDPYLRAAALLDVDPERCLALEDSPSGIESAVAAGCIVLAIPSVATVARDAERLGLHIVPTLRGVTTEHLALLR